MNNHCPFASLALLGLSACYLTPPPRVDFWENRAAGLTSSDLIDIAVLPVEDKTGGERLTPVLAYIRHEINEALKLRYYTALNTIKVDECLPQAGAQSRGSVVDAIHLGSLAAKAVADGVLGADGILGVQITQWDESSLLVDNRVRFDVKVTLLGSKSKKVLWAGGLRGDVEAGGGRAAPRDPAERSKSAAKEMVKELIGRLPRHRR